MAREWDSDQNDHVTFLMIFLSPMIHDTFVLWVIVNTEASLGRYLANTIHGNTVQKEWKKFSLPPCLSFCPCVFPEHAAWHHGGSGRRWRSERRRRRTCSCVVSQWCTLSTRERHVTGFHRQYFIRDVLLLKLYQRNSPSQETM